MARTALTHAENERKRARKYGSKCSILFTVRCTFFPFRPNKRNYPLITKLKKSEKLYLSIREKITKRRRQAKGKFFESWGSNTVCCWKRKTILVKYRVTLFTSNVITEVKSRTLPSENVLLFRPRSINIQARSVSTLCSWVARWCCVYPTQNSVPDTKKAKLIIEFSRY